MTEKSIQPWIAINGYINPEYRKVIVEMAWKHYPHASVELSKFSRRIFTNIGEIRGFRSVLKAPFKLAVHHITEKFEENPSIVVAVVCLWAEAVHSLIQVFQTEAETAGIQFIKEWDWKNASNGFIDFEEIPELNNFCDKYISGKETTESDHIRLATLWLSRAVILEPDEIEQGESDLNKFNDKTNKTSAFPDANKDFENTLDQLQVELERQPTVEKTIDSLHPQLSDGPRLDTSLPDLEVSENKDLEELPMTLAEMEAEVNQRIEKIRESQQATVSSIQTLFSSAQKAELVSIKETLPTVEDSFKTWEAKETELRIIVQRAAEGLMGQIASYSDLSLDFSLKELIEETKVAEAQPLNLAEAILSVIQEIHQYNDDKHKTQNILEDIRAAISKIYDDLAMWETDESIGSDISQQIEQEELEVTLTQLKDQLHKAQQDFAQVEKRLEQSREICLNRIKSLLDRLKEIETPIELRVSDEYTLGVLLSSDLSSFENKNLSVLESALSNLLNSRLTEVKSVAITTLASELRSEWDNSKFVQLLEKLLREKLDVEAFFFFLASNSANHREETIYLDRSIVNGLLNGLAQLSLRSRPFALLSNIAPQFLEKWETDDPTAKAELCLTFLAARRSGDFLIPAELLWQICYDWPIQEMVSWNRLWQGEIIDESLPIFVQTAKDFTVPFQQARSAVDQFFAHDRGFFVRLNSIKSSRHRSMLNIEIMPFLVEQLEHLQKLDVALSSAESHDMGSLVKKLEKFINGELTEQLGDDSLLDLYERGIAKAQINDSDPFHRRTSLHFLQECVKTILDYGQTMLDYWCWKLESDQGVTQDALQSELDSMSPLSTLGKAALEQIISNVDVTLPQWEPEKTEVHAITHLETELLSQATYTIRLPRLVGYLTNFQLNWSQVLTFLLDDLGEPLDYADAAAYLLKQESPNQTLFLTNYVPLETQKQAMSLQGELEREVKQLYDELIQLGGASDNLLKYRSSGRWGLIRQELNEQIQVRKERLGVQKERTLDQARNLRSTITKLDDEIFEIRDTIPTDAYEIIKQGLFLAKASCEKDANMPIVEAYIEEIQYRHEHDSWPVSELQNAYDELNRQVMGETISPDAEITAEKILDWFERNELKQLGLTSNDIPASSIGTRVDLLRNWLVVRSISAFKSEEMKMSERNAIQQVFRSFSKMMAMKRTLDPQGQPIADEHPVIYSYMDLQFPKTAVLDNHCVFIALPGNPPTAEQIKQTELYLEDKEWLDYFFVFLFIPGSNIKIRQRLQDSYRKQGLVIVDDPSLLAMILAEKQDRNPIGKLRPIMLNSLEADNIDVFKINQLVDNHSAIFVGREREVERYASREGNYAIYGGRRIGKSSVMKAVEKLLLYRGVTVVYHSFEGQADCSDDNSAVLLAQILKLEVPVQDCGDLKFAIQEYMDTNSRLNLVILLDEIDRYVEANQERHVLIETMRSLSERYGSRFRVVISGFMQLFDCLNGHGPYSPASDPWRRMLNDPGPLENLRPARAEEIVREGFLDILGWNFEARGIPQRIVELTGGHPAFVQNFCLKLQQRVGARGDHLIKLDDIEAVFSDRDPEQSFIGYIRKTLDMNLDPIGHYLILLMALESEEKKGFTFDEMIDYASNGKALIPDWLLERSLERLKVTSVVKETTPRVYEFSVPDYPSILIQLGENAYVQRLENELEKYLEKATHGEH